MQNELVIGPLPYIYLGDGLKLPTYPIVISLLFAVLIFYINKRARKLDYSGSTALDLFLWCVGAGAVGARLLHIVYEAPGYYLENPLHIFYFWQGGFVFYGGLICGVVAGWVYVLVKKQSFLLWLDFATPIVSLGYALGRWACFLAGCCYGQVCDLPWAISVRQIDTFTHATTYVHRHPTQLYASALEFLLLAFILFFEKKKILSKKAGHLFFLWLALHSLCRILVETFRADDRGVMLGSLSISMILSLLFISVSFVVLFRPHRKK